MLRKPTNRESWLYALANLGSSVPYQAFSAVALFFYTDVKHLAPTTAATIMTIYAIWNALNNPLIAHFSDRSTSPLGRRLAYIRFGLVPYALAFGSIWLVPFDAADQPLAVALWYMVSILLFEGFGTAVTVVGYQSLLAEMFPDYESRVKVSVRINTVQTIGLFIGSALPPIIAGLYGYHVMGIVFTAIILVAYAFGMRGMYEQPNSRPSTLSFLAALRNIVSNSGFVTVLCAQIMRFLTTNTIASGVYFYVKYSLGANPTEATLILTTTFIVTALCLPLWRRFIALRYDPRTGLTIAYAGLGLTSIPLYFAADMTQALFSACFFGVALAGSLLLGDVIMADVIDEDEQHSGERREAMFYAVNGAGLALSGTISSIYFGIIASGFGYDPLLTMQPATVGYGFRVYMIALPLVAGLLGAIAIRYYPLHGDRLTALRRAREAANPA
jgi:glycoside/pentoside/hexuronide:cation symporter, GPH family